MWQFEVLWHARREVPTGDVMYKWSTVAAQVWAVYSHYLPVSSSGAGAPGRSGVGHISAARGSIERLDLARDSLTRAVVTSPQQFHVDDWQAVQVRPTRICASNFSSIQNIKKQREDHLSLPIILFVRQVVNGNGHSPGTPAGRKTSSHINVNSWPIPEGRLPHRWWRVVCKVFNFSQVDPN